MDNNFEKTTQKNLDMIDIISVLGDDFSNIYLVNRESQNIAIYRYKSTEVGVREDLDEARPYQDVIQNYIKTNVIPEDQEKMRIAMNLDHVCQQLEQKAQFTVHYRIRRNGRILFYYMKCVRIGNADSFQHIVFAFANEDSDIRRNDIGMIKSPNGINGKRKILIVEDNALNREMLCALLEDKYEILEAENGEIGLQMLEQHYKELSVVLLDVQMPVCDGFEFLKRTRKDILLSSVPVIVTTASNNTDTELECLDLGASDFITKPYNADIVRSRINNVIRLKESTLTLAAVEHDELTGLYTEQAFLHYAKTVIKFNSDKAIHLIIAQIKDFKLVNNIYGTKKADEVLCYLASVFSENLKYGLLARTGGSSFACLTYDADRIDPKRFQDTVDKVVQNAPVPNLKVKYGVYENVDKKLSIVSMCDYASMAIETIIDNYECDVAYYTEEMARKRIYDQMIENSFEQALKSKEFVVYYQPKIDISTEKVIGAEALVRWKKPDGSMVSPGDFIPVYESNGLIAKLDEYVFREVCCLQRKKMAAGEKLLPISVNLSRSSSLYDGMADRYIEIVKENGIPFTCVPIELTESAAIYSDEIKNATQQLVDAGFLLHVDDFGSGYSSLVSLNQIPFSTLKIDKSLIDQVCEQKGKTLVEQVIVLSKLLNMNVVAEGVETKEQLDEIRKMKCDAVQGFYYARPMPEEEFLTYVGQHI